MTTDNTTLTANGPLECSYCLFYAFDSFGRPTGLNRFFGNRAMIIRHARAHPVGDPYDAPIPVEDHDQGHLMDN